MANAKTVPGSNWAKKPTPISSDAKAGLSELVERAGTSPSTAAGKTRKHPTRHISLNLREDLYRHVLHIKADTGKTVTELMDEALAILIERYGAK